MLLSSDRNPRELGGSGGVTERLEGRAMPIDYTKPCVRCGAADRDATGRCRPCWRITFAARNARSPLSPPVRPLAERFWAKVDKNGPIIRAELGHPEMARGENGPRAKLTALQVEEIRQRYAAGGIRQKDLGQLYGISQAAVCSIIIGKTWRTP
jgi:hypothetical protein